MMLWLFYYQQTLFKQINYDLYRQRVIAFQTLSNDPQEKSVWKSLTLPLYSFYYGFL